jgi:hypothetical protein
MKLKEWHRTVILLVLLALAIGFIIWANQTANGSFSG